MKERGARRAGHAPRVSRQVRDGNLRAGVTEALPPTAYKQNEDEGENTPDPLHRHKRRKALYPPTLAQRPSLLTESTCFSGGERSPTLFYKLCTIWRQSFLGRPATNAARKYEDPGGEGPPPPAVGGPAPSLRAWFPTAAGERQVREPEGPSQGRLGGRQRRGEATGNQRWGLFLS